MKWLASSCLVALCLGDVQAQRDGILQSFMQAAGFAQVLDFPDVDVELEQESEAGTPIAMMHGMGDFGNNPTGMIPLSKLIAKNAQAYVRRVELCSTPSKLQDCNEDDQKNGFLMTMDDQVDQFARVVQADPKFANGFNAVGFSQGNTVIRGYIHKYNRPPVKRHLSMHGVMMGVNGLPQCPMNSTLLGPVCRSIDWAVAHLGVYSGFVQDHLAQANYYRDATNLKLFREKAHFLPYINNEVPSKVNNTYKTNFASLEKLVLVMAEDDTVVHPKESEHFGYFKDGSDKELVAMRDAPWYTEDWFGLKTLDTAGKIDFYGTPGNHLRFKEDFLAQMVTKYLAPSKAILV
mmetsp:Transcript_64434/g.119847  ORF Transcript_64434/g.119847 Transcript_64434/m.119847 type:complete len:348 (-) Transcript_64434:43-1086(-)